MADSVRCNPNFIKLSGKLLVYIIRFPVFSGYILYQLDGESVICNLIKICCYSSDNGLIGLCPIG